MPNMASRTASLNRLAVSRLGGDTWELDGVEVTAVYNARHTRVNFGDERFKNVDMTGVNINSTGPALTIPSDVLPYHVTKGSEAYNPTTKEVFSVIEVEDNNGISYLRLKREAN